MAPSEHDFPKWWLALALVAVGCASTPGGPKPDGGVTADTHAWFPISPGTAHELGKTTLAADGPLACESCHAPTNDSFTQFSCIGCHAHEQTITNALHYGVSEYVSDGGYAPSACFSCHPAGARVPFDHAGVKFGDTPGIAGNCATCHDVGTIFAALPVANFTHPSVGAADCGACHVTTTWMGAGNAPIAANDPSRSLTVAALIPSYAGTSIASLTPLTETMLMPMNHTTTAVASATLSTCTNCHADAPTGVYFPGDLHSSLANLALPQPATCSECHAVSRPIGFVGVTATNPPRTPPSGEMKHDAVEWTNGAPGTTAVVTFDCSVCHTPPSQTSASDWANNGLPDAGMAPAFFHPSLLTAGKPQPGSCLDCHANTRPAGVLTAGGLPANVQFDHGAAAALGDCARCHNGAASGFSTWSGGKFHLAGDPTPASCVSCHAGERPTSTTGWVSTTYKKSPFDYVPNAAGITHGDGQDCALCHASSTQSWTAGHFTHGAATISGTTCLACHSTQRPDLQAGTTAAAMATLLGFDHSLNGTGDCFGCHQATVTANTYVNYTNAVTNMLPNGDWKGGQSYPGSTLVSSPTQFVTLSTLTLNRSGANNLVTSTTAISATLYNGMLHISTAIPAALNAGPATAPDNTKCWHCHTNTAGTVTAYSNGKYHASLTNYSATPGGAVVPFPQPTTKCTDCHSQMRPTGIVQKGGSDLQPMDHSALFNAAVTIGGASVTGVGQIECGICHASPGSTWADGLLHAKIGAAAPKDCTVCHYPVMADAAKADLTSGVLYAMKHRSAQLTFQNCQTCHAAALAKGATTPPVATLWQPGAYHPAVTGQPAACTECHGPSTPTAPTQSSVVYNLTLGATGTNKGQWMSHASTTVSGKDCSACHAADARASGAAWSKSISFHAAVANPATCKECHGATGANNNLPSGLTNSTMVSAAAGVANTGVAAGTLAQLTHADLNVTNRDCNACHTQVGVSTAAGVAGKEWAQAKFHANFGASNPLVINLATGRCSNCHLGDKPGTAYTAQNHSAYTAASGTTDCSSCHAFPGTGSVTAPNWLGASGGAPSTIVVGGFTVPAPPAGSATTQAGINNLPHPTSTACASCHSNPAGGKQAIGYDHASTLINQNCRACHEAGSNLVGTVWNGATTTASGAGDTRPYTLSSVRATKGTITVTYPKHMYPADCYQCHYAPTGIAHTNTGTAYTSAWVFHHTTSRMTNPGTCVMCHTNGIP